MGAKAGARAVVVVASVLLGACGSGEEASERTEDPIDRARETADRAEQRPDDVPEDSGY